MSQMERAADLRDPTAEPGCQKFAPRRRRVNRKRQKSFLREARPTVGMRLESGLIKARTGPFFRINSGSADTDIQAETTATHYKSDGYKESR